MGVVNDPNAILDSNEARINYNGTEIRREWRELRSLLEKYKVPIKSQNVQVSAKRGHNSIQLNISNGQLNQPIQVKPSSREMDILPVLINATFHPNWQRADGGKVYATTPFYQLTFVNQSVQLKFERQPIEWVGLWVSAVTLIGLIFFTIWSLIRRKRITAEVKNASEKPA